MSFTLSTGLMASNYAGSTKKSTASGVIFAGWAAGLVAGPREYEMFMKEANSWLVTEFFLDSEAPVYTLAFKMLSKFNSHFPSGIDLMSFLCSGMLCPHDYFANPPTYLVQIRKCPSRQTRWSSQYSNSKWSAGIYRSHGFWAMGNFQVHYVIVWNLSTHGFSGWVIRRELWV